MIRKAVMGILFFAAGLAWAWAAEAAARWPDPGINGVEWFYVFGREGNSFYGAEEGPKEYFVAVPKEAGGSIRIRVLDADIRGRHDEMDGAWNTGTKFSVFGGDALLDSRAVSSQEPDGTSLEFGPFPLAQGEEDGDRRIFRIVVEGQEGNDNNLFAFEIEPSGAELFSFTPNIRLAAPQGARMRFFPEIPSGAGALRVGNHDLDPDGGSAALLPPFARRRVYPLKNSNSAEWAWTTVEVPGEWEGGSRWTYQIVKATQPKANASLRVEDAQGRPLRIYFGPGAAAPQPRLLPCNTFLFDASKSYDPDNQALGYQWDFGDGTSGSGIRARHTYGQAGSYETILTVTDNSTADCRQSRTARRIRVNTPPQAALKAPGTACAGSVVQLSAADSVDSPGEKLVYRWDLGDGTTAEGPQVTHAYRQGGIYQVKLLVDDGQGTGCSTAQAGSMIRVNSPPMAAAADPIVLCSGSGEPLTVAFDGASATDPDNDRLIYRWDFGDGHQAEGKKVSHTYERGGRYTARLLVDDSSGTACSTAAAAFPVAINRAPSAPAFPDAVVCERQALAFDATQASDSDGDALSYQWDFGDGQTATGAKAKHQYDQGGVYYGMLKVDDGSRMECSTTSSPFTVRVNDPPVAQLKSDSAGCVGQALAFDATGSSDPQEDRLRYVWDFGDGTTAEGAKVRHAYAKGGGYPVTLKVEDGQGTGCSLATARAQVNVNTPPIADAGRNLVCCLGETAVFDASKSMDADGDTLHYRWDFGDGTTAEGARVEHAYQKVGSYAVRLTVSDKASGDCGTATSGFVATVNAPPVAQMAVSSEGQEI